MTVKFGIIRHRASWDALWPRLKYYPETCPLQDQPKSVGKGASIPVPGPWWGYIGQINDEAGYRYARSVGMYWINTPYNQDDPNAIPKAESITTCHNFISYEEETSTHLRVRAFPYQEDPFTGFNPRVHNWETMPHLFHKVICANLRGHVNPTSGIDVFLPVIKKTELYIPKSRVELFPALPFRGSVIVDTLRIRDTYTTGPESTVLGTYRKGDHITVLTYRLRGASVWGWTEWGWICLLGSFYPGHRQLFTTWTLNTTGVIPPTLS